MKTYQEWLHESYILEGVRKSDNGYEFDFANDLVNDIMSLKFKPYKGKLLKDGETEYRYYYGYFLDKSDDSTDLMKDIKLLDDKISDNDLEMLVKKAVMGLNREFSTNTYDTIVSPKSSSKILTKVVEFLQAKSDIQLFSDSFVKAASTDIKLDLEKLNTTPERIQKDVTRALDKIQKANEPFKIKTIFSRYRKFFKDFLIFNQENDRRLYNAVEGKKIILVDDYRTSGTSSKEMLRQLIDLGAKEILIFNLIKLGE